MGDIYKGYFLSLGQTVLSSGHFVKSLNPEFMD